MQRGISANLLERRIDRYQEGVAQACSLSFVPEKRVLEIRGGRRTNHELYQERCFLMA